MILLYEQLIMIHAPEVKEKTLYAGSGDRAVLLQGNLRYQRSGITAGRQETNRT